MSPSSIKSRLPKSSVSTLAPEPKTSPARITPPARQPTRTRATTLSRSTVATAPEHRVADDEDERRADGAQRSGKADAVRQHQAGKAAVPTAWEKKARPRRTIQVPSNPAGTARSEKLEEAALDELKLKGLEHPKHNENESGLHLLSPKRERSLGAVSPFELVSR